MQGPEREIEDIKATIAKFFPVYEVRVRPDMLTFFIHIEPLTLDKQFDELRKQLIAKKYIPFITKEKGEHIVLVQRKPQMRPLGPRVNLVLLGLTIVTTVIAGAVNWAGYDDLPIMDARSFAFGALFFALPLLAILGIHEMGHYITAKRYSVAASLPFFIPSIPPLGTFGAVISMRDPIPNRKALIDIGIAGPLFGLAVAIPVTILGLFLISLDPKSSVVEPGAIIANSSWLYDFLVYLIPVPSGAMAHPTAFAGWVGLFVTALNLLPAGQLDGGHVARAVLGEKARYLSYASIASLLILSLFFGGSNWFIIAILVLMFGARHPPPLNDITKLKPNRIAVGVVGALVFAATFVTVPFEVINENPSFAFGPNEPLMINATHGTNTTANFTIVNDGNMDANISLSLYDLGNLDNVGLNFSFFTRSNVTGSGTVRILSRVFTLELLPHQSVNVTLLADARNYTGPTPAPQPYTFRIRGVMVGGPSDDLQVKVNVI